MSIRILVADDHAVVREGLMAIVGAEEGMEVAGQAADAEEAVALAIAERPDLVIMDISMPEAGGIEATREIKQQAPDVAVLILTMHEDSALMQEALRAGAGGYVLKRAIKTELAHAVRTVLRGDLYLHPLMARMLLDTAQKAARDETDSKRHEAPDERLTRREIDVLCLVAQGYTNRQAAEKLGLSPRTVEFHRGNLTTKLGIQGRVELLRYAEDTGLL